MEKSEIKIREVETVEEMRECVELQRKVFASPDLEISPVRHLIVAKHAGGFTIGAYLGKRLVGFALTLPMFRGSERAFYSHMAAVAGDLQNAGIGAKLKWAQRIRALNDGANYIKWTYQPVLARNAFFNIERLGASVSQYMPNYYGTDAEASAEQKEVQQGIDSDRLFVDWFLNSPKVVALSKGEKFAESSEIIKTVEIPPDWNELVVRDTKRAIAEQERIKHEFQTAFAEGLIVKGFERGSTNPKYLLYKSEPS